MEISRKIVEEITKTYKENAQLVSYSTNECVVPGDNFMSVMYSLKIKIRISWDYREDTEEEIQVMLKCLPLDPLRTAIVEECNSFTKEVGMYTRIFIFMQAFQKSRGLMDDEIFKAWPTAYAGSCDEDFKFLAMQDLRVLGFKMTERCVLLDMTHTKLVLQGLARFHALSFAMFQGDYELVLAAYPFLKEQMFRDPSEISSTQKAFVQLGLDSVSYILREAGEVEAVEMWEDLNRDLRYFDIMHELAGSETKCAVITFGDCWKNNILFRYQDSEEANEPPVPEQVAFVDFQLARVASRVTDLAYFLFTSVDLDLLQDEGELDLLKYYHTEFKSFLKQLGVTPKLFGCTWKNFLKEYEKYRLYGVVVGLMLSPALYPAPSEAINGTLVENCTESGEEFENGIENGASRKSSLVTESDIKKQSDITKRICTIAKYHLSKCKL